MAAIQSHSEVAVKPRHPYAAVAVWCVLFFALVPGMCAQEAAAPRHTGFPQDWSEHQIVFSRDGLARHPNLIYREPRVLQQAMQRWQVPNFGVFHDADPLPTSVNKSGQHRDWSVALGGRLNANMFPSKFSFDVGAPPDCINDYVVFGLDVAGVTGGQANLVAFNNLYSDPVNGGGLCDPASGPGLGPNVLFAYNITTVAGGKIITSPILSLDGKKIGFVESVPGAAPSAIFHVLTWTAGGGLTAAAAPAPGSMLSVLFSPAANDTTSSPWIDYGADTVYVGADNNNTATIPSKVYQITGVFLGTPTLSLAPWPVMVGTSFRLTAPVLDSLLHLLMVGGGNGNLYQIDTTTGVLSTAVVGAVGGTTPGIFAPPIVDITNGTTFVVTANDGVSAALVEFNTFALMQQAKAEIGKGSTGSPGTPVKLYQPAFSNDYFNDPSTGLITLCGTGATDTSPWQYAFGFAGDTMSETALFKRQLSASTTDRCTGWTEFFNPNVGASPGTDFFFFGLTGDCSITVLGDAITATSVVSNVLTVTANNSFTVGETVYIQGTAESFLNGQSVTIASLIGSGPTYTGFTANFTASNYSNATDTGTVGPSTTGCVVALGNNAGTTTTTTAAVAGGPSGIVVDNYSTAAQASSIYLTAEGQQTAYKFTQNGLQ
jgi:hypothetical protein